MISNIYFKIDSSILSSAQKPTLIALTGLKAHSFSLLWRGSRDGFEASTFHRLCDGKGKTLTVIKNTDGFIFGGFTSVPWSTPTEEELVHYSLSKADRTAFVFSLTNPSDMPLKLKITEPPQNAVFHRPDWGPCFGDLMVRDLSDTHRNNSMEPEGFESPNGHALYSEGGKIFMGGEDGSFQTLEIEVFRVL